ncbi:MAG: hypothetical protein L3J69_08610 [Desulfobacula sp.]|nr:hypothetical protein [Desulfobacula sp.]
MNLSPAKHIVLTTTVALIYALIIQKIIASDSIMIVLAVPGLFLGFFLFNNPVKCFWILFYGAMLAGIAVSYIPGMYNLRWGVNLLSVVLAVYLLLNMAFNRRKIKFRSNIIFFLFTAFLFYVIIFSIINNIPTKQLIISLKNNFQFFPILLFFLTYPLFPSFSSQIIKAFTLIAFVQPPIALWQYFFIVPKVKDIAQTQSTAVLDAVNGTFGTSWQGGGSGIYALFTCIILIGILIAYDKKKINRVKFVLFSLYFLIPLFLNETKAAFIFMLMGSIIAIFSVQAGFLKKFLLGCCALLISSTMLWFTLQMTTSYGQNISKTWRSTLSYNIGESGYGQYRLNRLTCLIFWWNANKKSPIELLIGHGADATISGEDGLSNPGKITLRYPLYGTGLTTASQVLWEMGIAGFILFIAPFAVSFKKCIYFAKSTILSSQDRFFAICNSSGLGLTLLFFFYNSSFRNSQPANLLMTIMLGVTIWIDRQHYALKHEKLI